MFPSFVELLIVSATIIFLITFSFLFKSEDKTERGLGISLKYSDVLLRIHYLLLFSILLISIYSVHVGVRSWLYFFLQASVFITLILLLLSRPEGNLKFMSIFTFSVLVVLNSSIPLAENGLQIFGADQPTAFLASRSILEKGNILEAASLSGSYYSLIPIFSLLLSSVSLVVGFTLPSTFLISSAVAGIILAFTFYSILLRLTKDNLTSTIAVFIFLSIPRLTMVSVGNWNFSLVLGALLILILIKSLYSHQYALSIEAFLIALTSVVFHPTGIIVLLSFAGGLSIFYLVFKLNQTIKLSSNYVIPTRMFLSISVISFSFWIVNDLVLKSLIGPISSLFNILTGPIQPSIYTPQYYSGGLKIYAFAFALPVAFSGAYVIVSMLSHIRKTSIRRPINLPVLSSAVIGLLFLGLGFIFIIKGPGYSLERYFSVISYVLLLIPSAIVGGHLIIQKRKLVSVSILLLLAAFLFIGTQSPDWAPFENPEWGAIHTTYTSNIEANTISDFISSEYYVYFDNDIRLDVIAFMKGVSVSTTQSYQTTRNVLEGITEGTFQTDSFHKPVTLYIIKTSKVNPIIIRVTQVNLVYSSNHHQTFAYIAD